MPVVHIDEEFQAFLPPLEAAKRLQLEENIKEHGCLDPLKIWEGYGVILDGHNRFEICTRNDIEFKTVTLAFADRSAAFWWIIKNQFGRRDLTDYQRAELALKVESVIREKAKRNLVTSTGGANPQPLQNSAKAATLPEPPSPVPADAHETEDWEEEDPADEDEWPDNPDEDEDVSEEEEEPPQVPIVTPVDTRAELAKLAGVSHDTMAKAKLISEHAPEPLKQQVRSGEVSINKAAQETKKIVKEEQVFNQPMTIASPRKAAVPVFNSTNDNIEWAKWSWNPVTGCKHGCRYCYARDIAMRFDGTFEPRFREERLTAPHNTKVPDRAKDDVGYRNVFVCSMADLFGEWVPQEWIDKVMDACAKSPQWNYLFLTKNPKRLPHVEFPKNAWVGTTVDCQARVKPAIEAMAQVKATVRFLSCEPMLEELVFPDMSMFGWVIIGGQSKTTATPEFQPEWGWVWALTNQARSAGCKIYWKPNLTIRPKEYPETTSGQL